jgi:hypothetical protein
MKKLKKNKAKEINSFLSDNWVFKSEEQSNVVNN